MNDLKMVPLGTNMLVTPDPEWAPESIIERPESNSTEGHRSGTVIATGHLVPIDEFPIGTRVGFNPTSSYEWEIDGEPALLLDISEVRCVFTST